MAATFRLLLPLALVTVGALAGWRQKSDRHDHTPTQGAGWAALTGSMDTMHAAMSSVRQSGDSDADFVTLMLPHHRGAIEMAKAELMYGKDPQLRRLAQEIVTDQESEIQLMQLWLKRRPASSLDSHQPAGPDSRNEPSASLQQAPWGRSDIPVSSHDRVYAANQTSNTVSIKVEHGRLRRFPPPRHHSKQKHGDVALTLGTATGGTVGTPSSATCDVGRAGEPR